MAYFSGRDHGPFGKKEFFSTVGFVYAVLVFAIVASDLPPALLLAGLPFVLLCAAITDWGAPALRAQRPASAPTTTPRPSTAPVRSTAGLLPAAPALGQNIVLGARRAVGTGYNTDAIDRVARRTRGEPVLGELVPEPDNPHDSLALRVEVDGERLATSLAAMTRRASECDEQSQSMVPLER